MTEKENDVSDVSEIKLLSFFVDMIKEIQQRWQDRSRDTDLLHNKGKYSPFTINTVCQNLKDTFNWKKIILFKS